MSRGFATEEQCGNCGDLEDKISDLEYDLGQSLDRVADLESDMDKLSDDYDDLKADNEALNNEVDIQMVVSKDITDMLLSNMYNVLKHIDTHHPEVMFELLAQPELSPNVNLSHLMNDNVFQYSRTVYLELYEHIVGPRK